MPLEHAPARALTKANEGFYSDDPLDPGGETIWGISRNNPPNDQRAQHLWSLMWARVDDRRNEDGFPEILRDDELITGWSDEIYKIEWWDILKPDLWDNRAQAVINRAYDTGINMGPTWGVRFLQHALNSLGDLGDGTRSWDELDTSGEHGADGLFGPMTGGALHQCYEVFTRAIPASLVTKMLCNAMKLQSIHRREQLVARNRDLGRFLNGWIARDLRPTGEETV